MNDIRRPGKTSSGLAALCLVGLLAWPTLAAESRSEEEREPLGRPGRPYVVDNASAPGSAGQRSAVRTTPIPQAVLRALEEERAASDGIDAPPAEFPSPTTRARR